MAVEAMTQTNLKRPAELKVRMLQANMANRRLKKVDGDLRKQLFELLMKSYMFRTKDSYIKMPAGPKKTMLLKNTRHQAIKKFLSSFKSVLARRKRKQTA